MYVCIYRIVVETFKTTYNYCAARYEMYWARGDIFRKTVMSNEKNKRKKEKYFVIIITFVHPTW